MSIASVLDWKFNSASGITTKDGLITGMPDGVPIPTAAEIQIWTEEYATHIDDLKAERDLLNTDRLLAKEDAQLSRISKMTPAQIQVWVDTEITTLADVKGVLKTFAVLLSILARDL